jgi:hypothetical protein
MTLSHLSQALATKKNKCLNQDLPNYAEGMASQWDYLHYFPRNNIVSVFTLYIGNIAAKIMVIRQIS